ncbi:unnamed protein product, partial [Musa acuminata subsp. burmannicoides]
MEKATMETLEKLKSEHRSKHALPLPFAGNHRSAPKRRVYRRQILQLGDEIYEPKPITRVKLRSICEIESKKGISTNKTIQGSTDRSNHLLALRRGRGEIWADESEISGDRGNEGSRSLSLSPRSVDWDRFDL